jgi:hypothetical protein
MKSNGSIYVAAVLAVLAAYFAYVWWFNPERAMRRQLGELAGALSAPANEADVARLARLARLRSYLAEDVRIQAAASGPEITSRDALLGLVSAWTPPPGGWRVDFVDLQVIVDSESTGRGYFTVEVTSKDPATGQPVVDAQAANVEMGKREGNWVVTKAEARTP